MTDNLNTATTMPTNMTLSSPLETLLQQILEDSLNPSVLASDSVYSTVDMIIKAGEKASEMVYGKGV